MGLSSYSNYPLEDVASQGAGNPYVMQMCVLRDRAITVQLLERAESMVFPTCSCTLGYFAKQGGCLEAGYKALFLSVDVPVLGKRLNEYRNDYQLPEDLSWPNILSHGSDKSNRTEYGEFLIPQQWTMKYRC